MNSETPQIRKVQVNLQAPPAAFRGHHKPDTQATWVSRSRFVKNRREPSFRPEEHLHAENDLANSATLLENEGHSASYDAYKT